jgi:uncharacterized protein YlxW (UPF0749 family)
MAISVAASLQAFKGVFASLKALSEAREGAIRNTLTVELTQKIMDAQAAQAELASEVSALEAEVMRLKDWNAEKTRYELKKLETVLSCTC